MRALRDGLAEAKKEIPEIRGLSFFGSRTRGQERTDPEHPSDLDMVVFYDGSAYAEDSSGGFTVDACGHITINQTAMERISQKRKAYKALHKRIESYYASKLGELGSPVDYGRAEYGTSQELKNRTILPVDIAPEEVRGMIRLFVNDVDARVLVNYPTPAITTNAAWRLVGLFSLAAGNAILQARKYVLETWKADPKGELYFRSLMQSLAYIERLSAAKRGRVMVEYQRYPQTIEEGERIFLATVDSTPSRERP